ncbi:PadR family transcriptional regulator [Acidithrix sp. C25]|uniref:PadR family transcriptional regulator n=1 Tax=Acidithrix sp. C25 TaxID=1671482 RepID=UPI00191BC322|nr:PadR family transcriptional regulator [Acidithrix sp. C25]CAG4934389.1 unnamed protein product [Acidithrix sp. C25]
MKKTSSQLLDLAVLALLKRGDYHGYQIKKSLSELAGPLLQFSFGSLYPALARLEERSALESFVDSASTFVAATGSLTGDLAMSDEWVRATTWRSNTERTVRTRRVYKITEIGVKLFDELFEHAPLESEADFLAWLSLADESKFDIVLERFYERVANLERLRKIRSVASKPNATAGILPDQINRRLIGIVENEINFVKSLIATVESQISLNNEERIARETTSVSQP